MVVFALAQAIAVYVAFVVAWRWAAARRARGRRGIEARGTARSAYCVPSDDEEEEEEEEEDGDDDDDARDGVASGRRARRERGASARGDGASMMCARRATRAVAPLVVFSHETRFRSFPERKHFFF